jgi:hypothetical protein
LAERLASNLSIAMPGGTTTVHSVAVATASLILNEVAGNVGDTVTFG